MSDTAPLILWFRKDLRLDDNHALLSAIETGRPIVPVYILDTVDGPLGAAQAWWLHHSLEALGASLKESGSRLVLRKGKPLDVLRSLIRETGAGAVHWNRNYDPPGQALGVSVKEALRKDGISAESFAGQLLHEPTRLMTGAGGPYRVYTPFWRALTAEGEPQEPDAAPKSLKAPHHWPESEALADWHLLPTRPDWAKGFHEIWEPGEAGAQKRLKAFVKGAIDGYKLRRDIPGEETTSRLSPHLAFGEISPRRVWHATRSLPERIADEDYIHFRKELVWREFSYHLLVHFEDLATKNWNDRFDAFPWSDNETLLKAWQRGRTGYPIVDAGMRQLWTHGWMHNRVRMIAASFLIKDLLIDWRVGERWFRDTLVDADPASNAASWQWVAGSGADAAPFFRVFNPILQGEKFDAEGRYVRRFVPELAKLDNKFIHRPFEAPLATLKAAGISLGKTYPQPIVSHAGARDTALAAFAEIKGG